MSGVLDIQLVFDYNQNYPKHIGDMAMDQAYDFIVYIGRFQPFHDGHLETLKLAAETGKEVIVVIGSANSAPTPKNPWTAIQRQEMIVEAAFAAGFDVSKLSFIHVEDRRYKESKWISYVQGTVMDIVRAKTRKPNPSIALIGHEKDSSSYYLRQNFPTWKFVETGPYVKEKGVGKVVSSTKIRELMFENHLGYTESNLPPAVYEWLDKYTLSDDFTRLQDEYHYILQEEKIYEALPYGITFQTVDSVVAQSGHVLLVQRGNPLGYGLWALPGVHLAPNETLEQASMRAVLTETNLDVPPKAFKGSLVSKKEFDHPNRSLRARLTTDRNRTLTTAFYYKLDSSHPLPVKGLKAGEGILKAWWFPFSEVWRMRDQLFEDHADILDYFIG
jgi:bifunctional NMN adenylyltransferase/nudix hydrolase